MTAIAMPNGLKYRISSTRRYIVVAYIGGMAKWRAEYRTDVHSRAVARWREESRRGTQCAVIDAKAEGGPAVIR
jgi:hypothetical protein